RHQRPRGNIDPDRAAVNRAAVRDIAVQGREAEDADARAAAGRDGAGIGDAPDYAIGHLDTVVVATDSDRPGIGDVAADACREDVDAGVVAAIGCADDGASVHDIARNRRQLDDDA